MNRTPLLVAVLLASVVGAASCATQSSATAQAEDTSPLVTPAEVPWKQMTEQQRGRYMKQIVAPKMHSLFQAHDAEHYTRLSCATCHGKDARAKGFEMPNPDLPKLPASPEEFMATTAREKPEMVKFMVEQVTPQMAQLLGLQPFNPEAPDPNAFSCGGCHTLKGAPQAEGSETPSEG